MKKDLTLLLQIGLKKEKFRRKKMKNPKTKIYEKTLLTTFT